jgi:pimeloyl-ACP methyl ester carboxylesterase
MSKAENRTPQATIDGSGSQDVLKLSDGHTITYHTIGNASLPLMLFVVGSSGLGSLYRRLAAELSSTFRCVYYDKRGFLPADTDKTSVAKQTNQLILASQNADDAAALIKHVSPHTPVHVFGTSTGGTAVLDLVVRYPELIHTAVLHEPITFSVMPPTEFKDEILALYRSLPYFEDQVEGSKTYAGYMFRPHCTETSSALHASLSRVDQNYGVVPKRSTLPAESAAAFNARQGEQEGAAMLAYDVDVQRARSMRHKLLLIRGMESRGWPISQPVNDLAQALGDDVKVWELAGDHLSFAARRRVVTFAEQLVGVLRQEGRVSFSTDSEPRSRL